MKHWWRNLSHKARNLTYISGGLSILSIVLAVRASDWSITASVLAALLALVAAFQQDQDAKVYELEVLESDWHPNPVPRDDYDGQAEYVLTIPANEHQKGSAPLVILEDADGQEIHADVKRMPTGAVMIGAGMRLYLRVKIK